MKGIFNLLFIMIMLLMGASMAMADSAVEPPRECRQCGMDRVVFARGRMVIEFADGTKAGTCSLNCAAVEMKNNKDKKVKSLKVADYSTKRLIDVKKATWVLGGSEAGIMTELPKWAFARKKDAQAFVKKYGGRIADFEEALNLALRENE